MWRRLSKLIPASTRQWPKKKQLFRVFSSDASNQEGVFQARQYLDSRFAESVSLFAIGASRVGHYQRLYDRFCPGVLDSKSAKALDIGSGPSFSSVIGLVPHVHSVVLSDYAEENLDELELWKKESPDAFNWQPFMRAALSICYNDATVDNALIQQREKEIRGKVDSIVKCDVKAPQIVDPAVIPEQGFDVITCYGVINVAPLSNIGEFYTTFQNIHRLLKPGGLFFGYTSGRGSYYTDGSSQKFPLFRIDENDVRDAMKHANFSLKELVNVPEYSPTCDHKELYVFAAEK